MQICGGCIHACEGRRHRGHSPRLILAAALTESQLAEHLTTQTTSATHATSGAINDQAANRSEGEGGGHHRGGSRGGGGGCGECNGCSRRGSGESGCQSSWSCCGVDRAEHRGGGAEAGREVWTLRGFQIRHPGSAASEEQWGTATRGARTNTPHLYLSVAPCAQTRPPPATHPACASAAAAPRDGSSVNPVSIELRPSVRLEHGRMEGGSQGTEGHCGTLTLLHAVREGLRGRKSEHTQQVQCSAEAAQCSTVQHRRAKSSPSFLIALHCDSPVRCGVCLRQTFCAWSSIVRPLRVIAPGVAVASDAARVAAGSACSSS